MKTKKFGKSIPATIEKTEKGLEKYEDKLKRIAEKYYSFPGGKEEKTREIIRKCVMAITVNVNKLCPPIYTERQCVAKNKKIIREAAQKIMDLFLEEKVLVSIIKRAMEREG